MGNPINKTLCAIPFVGMEVGNNQNFRFCCIARGPGADLTKDGKRLRPGVDLIADAWNNDEMRETRRKMLAGEEVEACRVCYYRESIGKTSNREHSINEWSWLLGKEQLDRLFERAKNNNYVVDVPPVYLDLRLGSICNLKCRMCNPWNSTQIAKEHFELYDNNEGYRTLWHKKAGSNPIYLKEKNEWYESDVLWDEIISMIPNLRKVYMTGGEPTLVEGNFKFMEKVIEMRYQDKIILFFNMNCTNVNKRFLELIRKFKTVKINASLDGVGPANDYIRYPSKWDQVAENFERLAQEPNVELRVSPCLTVYNALEAEKIFYYIDEVRKKYNKSVGMDYLMNSGLDSLNSTILPWDVRQKALARVLKLGTNVDLMREPGVKDSFNGLVGILSSPCDDNVEKLREEFKVYTEALDRSRSQSLFDVFPEVYKALYE
jgi:MoaA/NifB/PqqE/SkfB family radical SAM enzyme